MITYKTHSLAALVSALFLCACGASGQHTGGGAASSQGTTASPGSNSTPVNNGNTQTPGGAPGTSNDVQLMGRMDASSADEPRFSWPNSTVIATLNGTFLKVKLRSLVPGTETPMVDYFDVTVDGGAASLLTLNPNDTEYEVCSGLEPGTHIIRISKRTESRFSTAQLLGAESDSPLKVAPSAIADRRIEFIGDSITAGYGTEASNPNDAVCQINRGEDADLSYAALTAQALGADFTNISWTGVGVLSPVNGNDTAATLFGRTIATDTTSQWGFQWQPQAVVINLGTNDTPFAAADPNSFSTAYESLLALVRDHYPNATIFCLVGPMLQGQDLTNINNGISASIQARAYAGDTSIKLVSLTPDDGSRGYACAQHPVAATHVLVAQQLTQFLKESLSW